MTGLKKERKLSPENSLRCTFLCVGGRRMGFSNLRMELFSSNISSALVVSCYFRLILKRRGGRVHYSVRCVRPQPVPRSSIPPFLRRRSVVHRCIRCHVNKTELPPPSSSSSVSSPFLLEFPPPIIISYCANGIDRVRPFVEPVRRNSSGG